MQVTFKALTYEEARTEHFEALKNKAERKMIYWAARLDRSRPNNLADPAHIKATEFGVEYNYYNDALKALEDNKFQYETGFVRGFEAAQPKWISVEERLPEEDICVLAAFLYYDGYRIKTARCSVSGEKTIWLIGDMCAIGSTPTHWMSLPSAPDETTTLKEAD